MRPWQKRLGSCLLLACASCLSDRTLHFWEAQDQRISLDAFGDFSGTFGWSADRSSMNADQLKAADGMVVIAGDAVCPAEILNVSITATDGAGHARNASANAIDARCGEEKTVVQYDSLEPLLSTLSCVATGQAGPDPSAAPTIRANDGCRHGFFVRSDQQAVWVKVMPSAQGGSHLFRVSACTLKHVEMGLYDAAGTGFLSKETQPTQADGCPELRYTLDSSQTYFLRVIAQSTTIGGHIYLELVTE